MKPDDVLQNLFKEHLESLSQRYKFIEVRDHTGFNLFNKYHN